MVQAPLSPASRRLLVAFATALVLVFLLFGIGAWWIWAGHLRDVDNVRLAWSRSRSSTGDAIAELSQALSPLATAARRLASADSFTAPARRPGATAGDLVADNVRFQTLNSRAVAFTANANRLTSYLDSTKGPVLPLSGRSGIEELSIWQLTRGLPERRDGVLLARTRRELLARYLADDSSIILAAELDSDLNVVYAVPYNKQLRLPTIAFEETLGGIRALPTAGIAIRRVASIPGERGGPFLGYIAPIERASGRAFLVLFSLVPQLNHHPLELRSSMGDLVLESPLATAGSLLEPITTELSIGGSSYKLLVVAPLNLPAVVLPRLLLVASCLAIVLGALIQVHRVTLGALDGARLRLQEARHRIDARAAGYAHDFRSRANSLKVLADHIGHALEPVEFHGFISLVSDISTYAQLLSTTLASEVLGFTDLNKDGLSYLRGSIDTVTKQITSRIGPSLRFTVTMSADSERAFVRLPDGEVSRILVNILSNAVEACNLSEARVDVTVTQGAGCAIIRVTDNGGGIVAGSHEQVFDDGYSTKGSDRGTGLTSARARAQRFGGDVLLVSSAIGEGTTFEILLPLGLTPAWFVDTVKLGHGSVLVVVDDEDMAMEYWRKALADRLTRVKAEGWLAPSLVHVRSPSELKSRADLIASATQFLVDQRFENDSQTGLQLIEELGLADKAILVTNLFEQGLVTEDAVRLGVGILPKTYVFSTRFPIDLTVTQCTK